MFNRNACFLSLSVILGLIVGAPGLRTTGKKGHKEDLEKNHKVAESNQLRASETGIFSIERRLKENFIRTKARNSSVTIFYH